MLTDMSDDLMTAAAGDDPREGLLAVHSLRVLADRLEALHVERARGLGWSWEQIAAVLGVSRQAVHKKFGKRFR